MKAVTKYEDNTGVLHDTAAEAMEADVSNTLRTRLKVLVEEARNNAVRVVDSGIAERGYVSFGEPSSRWGVGNPLVHMDSMASFLYHNRVALSDILQNWVLDDRDMHVALAEMAISPEERRRALQEMQEDEEELNK